jgi:hypothetical protein
MNNLSGAHRGDVGVLDSTNIHFPKVSLIFSICLGWVTSMFGILAIPPWAAQALVTIVAAPIAAGLAVIVKRWATVWARRRWPESSEEKNRRKPGDTDE